MFESDEKKVLGTFIGLSYYDSYINKEGKTIKEGCRVDFSLPYSERELNQGKVGEKVYNWNFNKNEGQAKDTYVNLKNLLGGEKIYVHFFTTDFYSYPIFTKIEKAL